MGVLLLRVKIVAVAYVAIQGATVVQKIWRRCADIEYTLRLVAACAVFTTTLATCIAFTVKICSFVINFLCDVFEQSAKRRSPSSVNGSACV